MKKTWAGKVKQSIFTCGKLVGGDIKGLDLQSERVDREV